MSIFEIIGGIVMILLSISIITLVLMQESPKGGGVNALTGGDSFYNKNQGRTRDAMLFKATKFAAIFFFVLILFVYAAGAFLR